MTSQSARSAKEVVPDKRPRISLLIGRDRSLFRQTSRATSHPAKPFRNQLLRNFLHDRLKSARADTCAIPEPISRILKLRLS
jgi:hypothetical protein